MRSVWNTTRRASVDAVTISTRFRTVHCVSTSSAQHSLSINVFYIKHEVHVNRRNRQTDSVELQSAPQQPITLSTFSGGRWRMLIFSYSDEHASSSYVRCRCVSLTQSTCVTYLLKLYSFLTNCLVIASRHKRRHHTSVNWWDCVLSAHSKQTRLCRDCLIIYES